MVDLNGTWCFMCFQCCTMELLQNIKSLLLLSLIHQAASLNIVATCAKTNDMMPKESWKTVEFHPSSLQDLDLNLIDQNRPLDPFALNVRWSINVDSSIHRINGTWIELITRSHSTSTQLNYRCDYQPAFTLNQNNYTGLEQLWFNFTSTEVDIEPAGVYKAIVYNLPIPPVNYLTKPSKSKEVSAPGCDDKLMGTHSICSREKPLTFTAVHEGDEIVVSFKSQASSQEYDIFVLRGQNKINVTTVMTGGKVTTVVETFHYSGHCGNLTIFINPYFKECGKVCKGVSHSVNCKKSEQKEHEPEKTENPYLLMSIGCAVAVAVLLMLICFCQLCRWRMGFSQHELTSIFTRPVRVLMVYPAVDSFFQHTVMALANFLQSYRDLKVVIDMWQRSSLAEQGPLCWLHSQVDQADKVLIVLPPQHIHTGICNDADCQKLHMVPGKTNYTVPASAKELFSLALNLVASSAYDPQHHHKFWVVHLGRGGERSTVPVQLRDCKTLNLPRDLKKVHQKLVSRPRETCPRLKSRIWSFHYGATADKLREAVQRLERSCPNCTEEKIVYLSEVERIA
ncbi:interleukin-17 receptor B isoform X2 [Salminus brasiliensis]|uniref:interleukin-17 receptor B isoform X2 n=1 Tax=Salminus brasiliensis TaxID=930266 RepID=UPI003B8304A6